MTIKPNSILFYAPDNSTYVVATDGNGFIVTVSSFLITPPVLTLTSGPSDNQPDFTLTGDLVIGDVVTISAYTNVGLTTLEGSGSGTVSSAGTLTVTNQLGPLTDGTKWYVAKTARSGFGTSANSNVVTNTIATFDAATNAWAQAVVTAGGAVSPTQKSRVNTLILALKGHSLFSANSRLWLHAGESDAKQATIDIMNLSAATPAGTSPPSLGASGYTGNGTTGYIDLGAKPSNYTQDSASFGCYNVLNSAADNFNILMGAFDGTNCISDIIPKNTTSLSRINRTTGDLVSVATATRKGFFINSATGVNACAAYKNGSNIGTNAATSRDMTALPGFFVLARNDLGTPSGFGVDIAAVSFIGPGLNDTQAANLTADIKAYMDAWGISVF